VKRPDLLIEVDNQLGFTRNFLTPAQREEPSPEDICAVLAAVMAHGCNLGVYTMAQLTSNVTYEQLKRIGDWHLTEEAQRSALAELVSAITDLDTSARWGQGKTAASDGQRFSLARRVLQQTYSTRFSDFALEFYTFVADNYAPFYSMPIECTDRDAACAGRFALQRERARDRRALHRHPRLYRDQFRRLRHAGLALLPAHPRSPAPAHLPD
jgi:hypothetical protein